ncbi:MAG: hypothetical protein RLZZ517_447 [Candidatus Parcubacteria bacterium]|jgi:hypothetical protein
MSIEFSEDVSSQQFTNVSTGARSGSAMVDFLINHGVVKDEKTANAVLVVGALIFIGISIYLFKYGFSLPA